ncbi:hypothetical protein HDC30_002474 [Pseudomonas sp. JAI115]|uniref:DUF4354 family protein n=1 Tax=Pseudomonas sp. JAI115 TaxID=2723061 RepID=UPI001622BDE0|nr:DUF4354 family protein [Pseudomonas sp. JAI115]MBB6155251.1 hypothetical protein [Pseudomonas sp. JAI115]
MNIRLILAGGACLVALGVSAQNSPAPSILLHSVQKDQGSVWTGTVSYYFKSFDAVLVNTGKEDIDLSTLCFKAYDAKGQAYAVDAMDEALAQGTLKASASVKGFYQFSGQDDGVYGASLVKAQPCPR